MGIYCIVGDEHSIEVAISQIREAGEIETGDGASMSIKGETTRGKSIKGIQTSLDVIKGLWAWTRRRKENEAYEFIAYELLSNNLFRVLKEKTLKDEAPVKKAKKMMKKKLSHQWPATAARR